MTKDGDETERDVALPESLEDMVGAMREDVLSRPRLDRVAAGVGLAAPTAPGPTPSQAPATSALGGKAAGSVAASGSAAKWITGIVVAIAVTSGGVFLVRGPDGADVSTAEPGAAAPSDPAVRVPLAPSETGDDRGPTDDAVEPSSAEQHVTDPERSIAPAESRPRSRRRPPKSKSQVAPPESADVSVPIVPPSPPEQEVLSRRAREEHSLLSKARRALSTTPRETLRLAAQHESEFPSGVLVPEREVLIIEALVRTHRTEAARARAERFAQRWPSSPYRRRVQSLVAED